MSNTAASQSAPIDSACGTCGGTGLLQSTDKDASTVERVIGGNCPDCGDVRVSDGRIIAPDLIHRFGIADRDGGVPHGTDRCLHCDRSFFEANDYDMLMWGNFFCVYDRNTDARDA